MKKVNAYKGIIILDDYNRTSKYNISCCVVRDNEKIERLLYKEDFMKFMLMEKYFLHKVTDTYYYNLVKVNVGGKKVECIRAFAAVDIALSYLEWHRLGILFHTHKKTALRSEMFVYNLAKLGINNVIDKAVKESKKDKVELKPQKIIPKRH